MTSASGAVSPRECQPTKISTGKGGKKRLDIPLHKAWSEDILSAIENHYSYSNEGCTRQQFYYSKFGMFHLLRFIVTSALLKIARQP